VNAAFEIAKTRFQRGTGLVAVGGGWRFC